MNIAIKEFKNFKGEVASFTQRLPYKEDAPYSL